MRKLTTKEQQKYITIKQYVSGSLTRKQAAVRLRVRPETVSRLKAQYQDSGKQAFSHGNHDNTHAASIDPAIVAEIVRLYKEDFAGFNFTHFYETLVDRRLIDPSALPTSRTIAIILERHGIRSPVANRIHRPPNLHPLRPRRERRGELVQIDASLHDWLNAGSQHKITLHASIDDATSEVLSGHFAKHETLRGYYHITKDILENYGIPEAFYADRRTVFEYISGVAKEQSRVHFQVACNTFGIDIITTSSPQAKGRVERLFRTMQDRLLSEMRHYQITSIEEANEFLPDYIRRHNIRFGHHDESIQNGFGVLSQQQHSDLDKILCIKEVRRILNGSIVSFQNKQYMPVDKDDRVLGLPLNTEVEIVRTFSGQLLLLHNDIYYPLIWTADGRFTGHTPLPTHPWRQWRDG